MPKKARTKTKTNKKVVESESEVSEVSEDEVLSDEEVLSSNEVDLLEEESTGDATDVLDVSKNPDFESELSDLSTWFKKLDEKSRLTVFLEEYMPWFNERKKQRMKEEKEDERKFQMFLTGLNKTSTLLKALKKKETKRNTKKANSNREYGFNKEIEVPKVFIDFFGKHLPKEVQIKKKSGNINTIKVSNKMKRPDITALLYEYCNQKNLKLESDRRVIKPDKNLRKLFGDALDENENLTFTNFQTKLKYVMDKNSTSTKKKKKTTDV